MTPLTAAHQASLSFTISQSLLRPCPLSQWCHPTISSLLSSAPPALNLSKNQGLFQWVSSLHQEVKVLELQFQHQSFQWIFRVDSLYDWLVWSPCCPRDSKESTQHHSSKASILQHSAFLMVQLSHLYSHIITTGKTIALTIWTFVGKVMPLLFNMPSRFVIAFLPRSKHLLISWLHESSTVIFSPRK